MSDVASVKADEPAKRAFAVVDELVEFSVRRCGYGKVSVADSTEEGRVQVSCRCESERYPTSDPRVSRRPMWKVRPKKSGRWKGCNFHGAAVAEG